MSNNQKVPYTRIGNYRRKGFLALTATLALLVNQATAATFTWDGGGNNNINDPVNWVGDVSPGNALHDIIFTGTIKTSPLFNPTVNWTWNSITFNGDANFTINRSANAGILGTGAGGITCAAPGTTLRTYSILDEFRVTANQIWTTDNQYSALVVNQAVGNLDLGANTLTLNTFNHADATITIGSAISGSGAIIKAGAGTMTLSGANTYSGGTTVNGGLLVLDDTGKSNPAKILAQNTDLTISGATVSLTGNQWNSIDNRTSGTITLNSGGTLSASQATFNAHHVYHVKMNGGLLTAGAGTLDGALANWYVTGTISNTANSTISASLGASVNNAALPVDVTSGTTLLISGTVVDILGANGLTKTGSGTLTLTGDNSFSGNTIISATGGKVIAGHNNALGTGTVALNGNNATLELANGITVANAMTVSGSGNGKFIRLQTGAISATYSGNIVNSEEVAANFDLFADTAGTLTLSGILSGNGFEKNGAGTVILTGENTYSGGTTISLGKVIAGHNNALGSGTVTLDGQDATLELANGITVANDMAVSGAANAKVIRLQTGATSATYSGNIVNSEEVAGNFELFADTAGTLTLSGIISGGVATAGLDKQGAGTVILTGNNTYSGATAINAGTLAVFAVSANIVLSGTYSGAGTLNVGGSGSGQGAGLRVNIVASALNGFTGTVNLDNTANYIDLNGGISTAKLKTSGATSGEHIRLWGSHTFGELSGTGGLIAGDNRTLTINQSTDSTYGGKLSNVTPAARLLSLTKTGSGTLTLTGANDYQGGTTISAGKLLVNGSHSGVNGYTVDIGATLGGGGTITAAATVNGIVSPGSTAGAIGQLNVAGNVTWNGASGTPVSTRDWLFQLGANNASDVLNITGNFNKGSGSYFRFNFGGTTSLGTFKLVDWSGSTTFSASHFSYDASSLGANQDVVFLFNGSQLEVVLTVGCLNPPTVTLGASPTVCRGVTSSSISYSDQQNSPDQYYIDYSDTANTSGGFVDVGVTTLGASPIPLSVPVAAPVGTYNGTLYVINSAIGCRSLGIPFTVTVIDTPSTPGTISGSASVCQNTSGLTYSIAAVASATNYNWGISGGTITATNVAGTQITVDWSAAGSGSITVNAQNSCGTSAGQSSLTVTIVAGTPGAPDANAARVITATSFLASWSSVSGAAGYRLDVATTADFQSGTFVVENQSVAGTSTTVGSLTTGVTYYYRVRASNACGTSGNSDVISAVPSPILAAWDMSGLSNYGSSPEAATVANADVTAGGLTRGSGLSGGTSAVRGWGGTNWANLEVDAVSGSKFATFTVKGNANRNVSITSISTFDYRLDSANGPVSGKLQYALDGVTFTDVPDVTFTYDVSASGGSIPPIELSGVAELQNVPDTVTVTFRILNYGASSSSESWYIYDKNNLTDYDFEVRGLICNSPTTYALNGGGTFCSASFSDTTLSLAGSESGVTYQLYTNNQLNAVGSPVAGTGSAISFGQHSAPDTYTVLATRDSGGCSKVVGTTTITVLTTPGAPTSLVAPLNGIQVELNWHAPAGTKTGYKVYRRTSSGSYGTAITTINSGATTNYVDSPAGGETYYYQVTALNGSCEGTASSEAGPVVVPANCPDGIRPTLSTQGLTALAASVRVNIAPSLDISIIAADSAGCTPPTFEMNGISGATPGVTITDTPDSPAAGSSTRRIQWTPGVNEVGTYPVSLTATDSQGLTTSITFVIYVGQQSDTVSGGVPSSQTNWNIPIMDIRIPSSGNATVVWESVDGIHYDILVSTQPVGGGASWSKEGATVEADASLSTGTVANSGTRYYNVVPAGQSASERGVWGIVRPAVPAGTITYMAPPVPETASDLDFSGNLGDALAAALTDPDDRIYVMSSNGSGAYTTLRLANGDWIIDGGGAYTTPLAPGQGFLIVRASGSASPTFEGPVGNTGQKTISLAVGYNIIGISEGRALPAATAFNSASPVGSYDEEQADQVVILNSDGSFRRLWRLGQNHNTWYDTETGGATSLILQPGQAYYYVRRGSATTLNF